MLRFLLFLAVLLSPNLAQAKWREASTRHFVIYSEQSERDLRRYAEELERFDRTLRLRLNQPDDEISPSTRLTIYVLPSVSTLQQFLEIPGAAGVYFGRSSGSIAFTAQERVDRRTWIDPDNRRMAQNRLTPRIVLFHEYTHHFLFNNFSFGAPLWLSEGYPEFWSTTQFGDDGSVRFGIPPFHRNMELAFARPMPVRDVLMARHPIRDSESVAVIYARGGLLAHYLEFEPGRAGQLDAYLRALGEGRSAEEAAAVFGDLGQLDRELERYFRAGRFAFNTVPASQFPPSPVTIRELRPGEEAVMRVRMRSKRGVTERQARDLVPEARRAAAPYPDDPIAQVTLAEAEFDAGNLDEAEAAADRAIAADPRLVDAHLYKARAMQARLVAAGNATAEQWGEVREIVAAANRLDPEDPEPLVLFFETYEAAGEAPTQNAVAGLIYAHQLAPEDRQLRVAAARQLLAVGNAGTARRVLQPVTTDSHSGAFGPQVAEVLSILSESGPEAALAKLDEALAEAKAERERRRR